VSSTTEDYLKRILAESESTGEAVVSLGRLATLVGVTPGTVTSMMKSLAESGLVTYRPRYGVQLTRRGRDEASRVLRRHRLIELFLVDNLGFDWSEVHSEAEVLEHAVSDRIVERLDEMLGHPTADPHGDPIPTTNGEVEIAELVSLSETRIEDTVEIVRVAHDDSSFLRFLKENGLVPGTVVLVAGRDDLAETIRVGMRGGEVTLSLAVAKRILVKHVEEA
jgi:DtxR family Mn-dependent transcriptional regulator